MWLFRTQFGITSFGTGIDINFATQLHNFSFTFVNEMKRIAFILSILILTLSLQPCSDGEEDKKEPAVSKTHKHSKDNDDSCPITCICNCCGITITFQPLSDYKINSKILIPVMVFSEYPSNYRFNFLTNIWHPPKIIC